MRRFWKTVSLEQGTYGHGIRLDGRVLKTPQKAELYLPTRPLADAVVAEWEAVGESIDPIAMPMTGFANAAIDPCRNRPPDLCRGDRSLCRK
jgi:chaperone required for assembly of F1-ATPase